ncbi:MAG: A24 family peptidase [Deltaproteobacteria bacterium]|nr:A24 family peptidase [Deltaproteobacteria bacterium]
MKAEVGMLIAVCGAAIGSFLNVCIYRLPRTGLSPLFPVFSFCPKCQNPIKIRDNVPLISFLLLKGRCRSCAAKISPSYLMVELLGGFLAVITVLFFGFSLAALWLFFFFAVLIVIAGIDWEHMVIPDSLSLGGMAVSLICAPIAMKTPFSTSIIGALAGGSAIIGINFIYKKTTGREGFGFGDAKLLAFIGAALGWQALVWIIFLSSFCGAIVGIAFLAKHGLRQEIPFAPFLAFAAIIYPFCQPFLWKMLRF